MYSRYTLIKVTKNLYSYKFLVYTFKSSSRSIFKFSDLASDLGSDLASDLASDLVSLKRNAHLRHQADFYYR